MRADGVDVESDDGSGYRRAIYYYAGASICANNLVCLVDESERILFPIDENRTLNQTNLVVVPTLVPHNLDFLLISFQVIIPDDENRTLNRTNLVFVPTLIPHNFPFCSSQVIIPDKP